MSRASKHAGFFNFISLMDLRAITGDSNLCMDLKNSLNKKLLPNISQNFINKKLLERDKGIGNMKHHHIKLNQT